MKRCSGLVICLALMIALAVSLVSVGVELEEWLGLHPRVDKQIEKAIEKIEKEIDKAAEKIEKAIEKYTEKIKKAESHEKMVGYAKEAEKHVFKVLEHLEKETAKALEKVEKKIEKVLNILAAKVEKDLGIKLYDITVFNEELGISVTFDPIHLCGFR